MKLQSWLWVALVPALSVVVPAQDQTDPPSRVARLNYVYGTVSFRPASLTEWAPATLNYPLTTGDHLWTDDGGSAELHIGRSAVRLSSQAAFGILNLDDHSAQASLSQGSMNVRLGAVERGQTFEIDTPNGAVTLSAPGVYRIDVSTDKNFTAVTVRSGQADVVGNGQQFPVQPGHQSRFMGTDELVTETVGAPTEDGWDQWCATRDHRVDASLERTQSFASEEMTGIEDLAENGTWTNDAAYGAVWQPTSVDENWQPYTNGHWAFVAPWGWTWVDDAPWGFAPFHYGRWAMIRGGWGWVPGVYGGYSPALVAFMGGPGFGLDLTAWIPLGPGERFHPWYGRGALIGVDVGGVYMNRAHMVAVNTTVFAGARSVRGGVVPVSKSAVAGARPMAVAARPTNEAKAGRPMTGGRVATPPSNVASRPVLTRNPSSSNLGGAVRTANPSAPASHPGATASTAGRTPSAAAPANGTPHGATANATGGNRAVSNQTASRPAALSNPAISAKHTAPTSTAGATSSHPATNNSSRPANASANAQGNAKQAATRPAMNNSAQRSASSAASANGGARTPVSRAAAGTGSGSSTSARASTSGATSSSHAATSGASRAATPPRAASSAASSTPRAAATPHVSVPIKR